MIGLVSIIAFFVVMGVGVTSFGLDVMDLGSSPTMSSVNSTMWSNLYNNTYSAFNLAIIVPMVVVAGLLVALALFSVGKAMD